MVMNCDTGTTIALSLLMTTNATLFTDKYIKTVTKHLPHLISTFMFGCVLSAHNKRICYVTLCNSHLNAREYPHKTYLTKNWDPWATFLLRIVWVYLHSNFSGWLRKNVCNATECVIAVQGHFGQFGVNQGR